MNNDEDLIVKVSFLEYILKYFLVDNKYYYKTLW